MCIYVVYIYIYINIAGHDLLTALTAVLFKLPGARVLAVTVASTFTSTFTSTLLLLLLILFPSLLVLT